MNEIKIERISFHRRYDEDNKQNATVSIPEMVRLRDIIKEILNTMRYGFHTRNGAIKRWSVAHRLAYNSNKKFPYQKWCD